MKKNRFAIPMAVTGGLLFLSLPPALLCGQTKPPGLVEPQPPTSPAARAKHATNPMDDFAGLHYTPDQQAKVDKILRDMKVRIDAVARDERLNQDQKGAMLLGLARMERGQVFSILTKEQQKEVRDRIKARQAAERAEQMQKQPPPK